MKKVLLLLFCILGLNACSFGSSPTSKVEDFMNNYTTLSENVIRDIDTAVNQEELSESNKTVFKDVLKRQYGSLSYTIKDEQINGDEAVVRLKITVYDLFKSNKESLDYLNSHNEEFYVNQVLDNEKYTSYRINNMLTTTTTVDYEITLNLSKVDGDWVVENPDKTTIEKIHGLYNYEG